MSANPAVNPALQTSRLVGLCIVLGFAAAVAVLACGVALYAAASKRIVVIGATDSGRIIPAISLNKPYLNEARIQALRSAVQAGTLA